MKQVDPALHELARRAMTAHAASAGGRAAVTEAMESACGSLHRVLETAIGAAGLEALISRAIQITARQHPWLAPVTAGKSADCPLTGLSEAAGTIESGDAVEGCAALLATMLSLLSSFIGEDLTMRFVRHAWPNVSLRKVEGSE